jgi:sigma-54 dependent transcriptional regulator, acetoin dehydrogenase operon transcriptional activator AcoR
VIADDVVVGMLISGPGLPGERLRAHPPAPGTNLNRVLGIRAQRLVVLAPEEIRFAEADGNTVWMTTDRGRLRAFGRGLGALEDRVAGHGFLRVSRQSLVNLNRVREIAPSFKGGFGLAMDGSPDEVIPVSRRHAAEVRRILGLG